MVSDLNEDRQRYFRGKMPLFQIFFRKAQNASHTGTRLCWKILFKYACSKRHIELSVANKIGGGLYVGHPYCITVNPQAVIGRNVNIHKGVTIGQENRGKRKGAPTIGNKVWIGVNATVVGKIKVGDNVLIAPNSYVNCDIPSHSVVLGNPCVIMHDEHATDGYINSLAGE